MSGKTASQPTKRKIAVPGFFATIAAMLRDFARDLTATYRPERHYMRGPGPKWRERRMQAA